MARKKKSETATIAITDEVLAAPVIDHETQYGSWTPPEEIEAIHAEVEDVVRELEAIAPEVLEAPDEDVTLPENASSEVTFDDLVASFDQEKVLETVKAIDAAFADRQAFETAKDPDNANIHRTLKKARDWMTQSTWPAKVMMATNVDPSIINREIHTGSRYNVYAIGKLADAIAAVGSGIVSNAINNACMRSLFKFRAADLAFTGEMAKAAASDKIRIADSKVKAALVRHTVSASTAPTQASSTMQALTTLGIVKREGSSKNPTYTVSDHPIAKKLERALAA